jgi:hypothetical protein
MKNNQTEQSVKEVTQGVVGIVDHKDGTHTPIYAKDVEKAIGDLNASEKLLPDNVLHITPILHNLCSLEIDLEPLGDFAPNTMLPTEADGSVAITPGKFIVGFKEGESPLEADLFLVGDGRLVLGGETEPDYECNPVTLSIEDENGWHEATKEELGGIDPDSVWKAIRPDGEAINLHTIMSSLILLRGIQAAYDNMAQKRQKRPYYKSRMKDSRVEMTHTKAETRLFRISRKPEMNITAEEFDGRPISLGMGKLNTVTQLRVTDETLDLAELEDRAGKPLLSFTDLYWLNWWESVVRDNPESRVMYGTDLMTKAGYSNPRKASQDDVRREVLDVATHLTGIYGAIDAEGENRAYGDRRTVRSIKRRRFAEFSIDVEQYDDGTWDFKLTRQDIGQETPFPLLEYAEDKGEAFQIPSWVFKFPIKLSSKVRKALFYILRQALIKGVSDTIDLATMLRAFGWEDMDKYAKHRLLAGIEKGLDYWKKKCSPKVIHSWNWEYEGRRTVAVAVHANHRLLEQNQKLEKAESARRSAPLLPDPDEGGEDRG